VSRIAMGHEVAVTSLQMLNAMCAIGNEGQLMKPLVVQRVVGKEGRTIMQSQPEVLARPIRPETARLMCKLLSRTTEDGGTGTKARLDGYTVAGKTGTAQKPVPGGYSDSANIASFVGFVPAENPEIGIIVVVDEPQPLHTGGAVSAPIFREIAEQAVRYLDIPPVPEERAFRFGDVVPTVEL
jgi:cell division protein FtsI (penicillin-binding protein 3)